MRITSKGQVTIPQDVRKRAGLLPYTEVEFVVEEDGTVKIIKARNPRRPTRGELLVQHLRSARNEATMTTDEIMALTRGEGD